MFLCLCFQFEKLFLILQESFLRFKSAKAARATNLTSQMRMRNVWQHWTFECGNIVYFYYFPATEQHCLAIAAKFMLISTNLNLFSMKIYK